MSGSTSPYVAEALFLCVISCELLSACDGGTSPVFVGGFSVILAIGSSCVASKDLVAPL